MRGSYWVHPLTPDKSITTQNDHRYLHTSYTVNKQWFNEQPYRADVLKHWLVCLFVFSLSVLFLLCWFTISTPQSTDSHAYSHSVSELELIIIISVCTKLELYLRIKTLQTITCLHVHVLLTSPVHMTKRRYLDLFSVLFMAEYDIQIKLWNNYVMCFFDISCIKSFCKIVCMSHRPTWKIPLLPATTASCRLQLKQRPLWAS